MYCVSLDPGGTTGVCLVRNRTTPWTFVTEQIGPELHHRHLLVHLTMWRPELIICEGFDERGNTAAENISLEYIGIVRAYAQSKKCQLVMQSSSIAKQFWKDDKLKHYGVWCSGKHARDAVRHYLYYRSFTLRDDSLIRAHAPRPT